MKLLKKIYKVYLFFLFRILKVNKVLYFNIGHSAGFYSEFNNMMLAYVYCSLNNIRFVLYTRDANFKIRDGWEDFFRKFPECTNSLINRYINERIHYPSDEKYLSDFFEKFCQEYKKITGRVFRNDFFLCNKKIFPYKFFTFELWNSFRYMSLSNEEIIKLTKKYIEIFYKYNERLTKVIADEISLFPFERYVGLHIRGGDKITEFPLIRPEVYMSKVKQVTDIKNIFVFTDDYQLFEQIKFENPDYNFYTIVDFNDNGYSLSSLMKEDVITKQKKLDQMFTSVEIICRAEFIVCTLTSNPGMFWGMKHPDKTLFVDSDFWHII